ncbi:hypothetical protein E2566_02030 [Pectobacterium punjabense]|uniref:Phosphate starvation-inducible protein PhoH n=1 Tax=Pectobacterium punjabense TaxID=2108399 RepID=A0ABX6KZ17_9GAMM|nr:hypothetical protein [Pectobacterium punjabense]MBS4432711.1 hypothetical protein [Pectobacterium punjabense]PTA62392.1 hypothetical protein C9I36_20350 [Pectobacterium punjabense]QJA18802.1 hypothetical protein E2566_02030 [Pectobacterium punjabense]
MKIQTAFLFLFQNDVIAVRMLENAANSARKKATKALFPALFTKMRGRVNSPRGHLSMQRGRMS